MSAQKNVYIAGALSGIFGRVRLEVFYEMIGSLCEKKGFNVFIPHRDHNFDNTPDMTYKLLYEDIMKRLKSVDLLIAYVGAPSTGVGLEVQECMHLGVDVIIVAEEECVLSKPLQGCPAVIEKICFDNFDDAMEQLEKVLNAWPAKKENKATVSGD